MSADPTGCRPLADSEAARLERAGLLGSPRARAWVSELQGPAGTIAPERVLTARLYGSLDLEVLPSRGLDIGDTRLRGVPVSWFSPVSDARALDSPRGHDWGRRFTGGLVTTCGYRNVGPTRNDQGQHGDANHLPARQVSWRALDDELIIHGIIDSAALVGPSFRTERTISLRSLTDGSAEVDLTDVITCTGSEPAPLEVLYHVNLGAPLVVPGTWVDARAESTICVDGDAVLLHEELSGGPSGWASVSVTSPQGDRSARISWRTAELPLAHEWRLPVRSRYALGIEPCTTPLHDEQRARLAPPLLEPGESREHRLTIEVHDAALVP